MSSYSDQQDVAFRQAEQSYANQSDLDDREEEVEYGFLCWEPDTASWCIADTGQIKEAFEHGHYAGFGAPTHIYVLPEAPLLANTQPGAAGGTSAGCGAGLIPVWPVIRSQWSDTENDFYYSNSELVDEAGNGYGSFTTRIDGRA